MKKLIFLGILLFSFYFVKAQENDSLQNSVLWEISGNGIEKPSYIFGTIHLIPKDDYFFTDLMKEKFDACEKLVLEVDMNIPLSEQIKVAKQMFLPNHKKIFDYMTPDDSAKFTSYLLDSLKISRSSFKKITVIKPFFSSALILKELIGKTKTYEEELNKRAKKNKMETEGLETLDFQMSLANDISVEEQVEMMFKDELSSNPLNEYNKLIAVYKKQDLNQLKKLIDEDESMAIMGEKFLKKRNENWISKIEKLTKEKPCFIAVGAGHLAGKDGVINLLRAAGYTLIPVK